LERGRQLRRAKTESKTTSIAAKFKSEDDILELSHTNHGTYRHKVRIEGNRLPTKWVLDRFETIDQGDEAASWISQALEKKVRLVTPGASWNINLPHPMLKRMHGVEKQQFYAAAEVPIANQASLDDLNTRINSPIPMDRFRVNIVVEGIGAYEEDEMETPSNDILKVLGETRRRSVEESYGSGLLFSNYMTVRREGRLQVGDQLRLA
jgi:uncharacterized protein YcbX